MVSVMDISKIDMSKNVFSAVDVAGESIEQINDKTQNIQLVTFNIGQEEFGVDILTVQEIIRMIEITRVPNTKKYVKGVINLRGKIIPIINLRGKLNISHKVFDRNTRIIVVEKEELIVGFIVDEVNEVTSVDKTICEPPPPSIGEIDITFIDSVAKLSDRLLILLNLDALLVNLENDINDI